MPVGIAVLSACSGMPERALPSSPGCGAPDETVLACVHQWCARGDLFDEVGIGGAIRLDSDRILTVLHRFPSERHALIDGRLIEFQQVAQGAGGRTGDWVVLTAFGLPESKRLLPVRFDLSLKAGDEVWLVGYPPTEPGGERRINVGTVREALALAPLAAVRGVVPQSIRTRNGRRVGHSACEEVHVVPAEARWANAEPDVWHGFSGGAVLAYDRRDGEWVVAAMIVGGQPGQATLIDARGSPRVAEFNDITVAIQPRIPRE